MNVIKKMTSTLLILTIILGFTCNSEKPFVSESECKILHGGTFKYGSTEDDIKVKIEGKNHTEYHNGGKYLIKSKLHWVSDCEYNMTITRITIPNFPYRIGDIMNVKIVRVKENEIFYTSTINGESWGDKLIKVK